MTNQPIVHARELEEEPLLHYDTFDYYEPFEEYVQRTEHDYPNDLHLLCQSAWEFDQADAGMWYYQNFIGELQSLLDEVNPDTNYWHGTGTNLGWRHRSADRTFKARSAIDWLHAFLPGESIDDCVFSIYAYTDPTTGKAGLRVVNSHHDAMGEEYILLPLSEEEWDEAGGDY